MGSKGLIASTAGLAPLLLAGIGDTIRVSLTPKPGGDRTEEVQAAQQILQSLSIRSFMPQVTSCPGCGRTTSTYFQELAEQIQSYLAHVDAGVAEEVSGRGRAEAGGDGLRGERAGRDRSTRIWASACRGRLRSRRRRCMWTASSATTLHGDTIVAEFKQILDNYVESHYGQGAKAGELVGTR